MKSVRIYHPNDPKAGTLQIPEQCLPAREARGWKLVKENEAPKIGSRKK